LILLGGWPVDGARPIGSKIVMTKLMTEKLAEHAQMAVSVCPNQDVTMAVSACSILGGVPTVTIAPSSKMIWKNGARITFLALIIAFNLCVAERIVSILSTYNAIVPTCLAILAPLSS
jgi:hypothetical protein